MKLKRLELFGGVMVPNKLGTRPEMLRTIDAADGIDLELLSSGIVLAQRSDCEGVLIFPAVCRTAIPMDAVVTRRKREPKSDAG
jgi:hypothetical protein